jgi:hypothetical protein
VIVCRLLTCETNTFSIASSNRHSSHILRMRVYRIPTTDSLVVSREQYIPFLQQCSWTGFEALMRASLHPSKYTHCFHAGRKHVSYRVFWDCAKYDAVVALTVFQLTTLQPTEVFRMPTPVTANRIAGSDYISNAVAYKVTHYCMLPLTHLSPLTGPQTPKWGK